MQFSTVLHRSPIGKIRLHGFDNGADLARVDAPHAQEAEVAPRLGSVVSDHGRVAYLGGHIVRRHDIVGQGGRGDFRFGANDQRVGELFRGAHCRTGDSAMV